jgi:polyisoprenoid-binding protein YceI
MKALKLALPSAVLALMALAPALAAPTVYKIDPVHSSIGFTVRHIVSLVPGRFNVFTGEITIDRDKPEASKVSAEIDAKSINTEMQNRDDHLRSPEFFDVEKFPKITFDSTGVISSGKDKTTVTGNLTMHGVTKPVTLEVSWLGFMGPKAGFEAKGTINRKDFGITYPGMADDLIKDQVSIKLAIHSKKTVS